MIHTDAKGKLLDPPIPLPDFDNPDCEIRSPQNPFNEETNAVRIMNAVRKHARINIKMVMAAAILMPRNAGKMPGGYVLTLRPKLTREKTLMQKEMFLQTARLRLHLKYLPNQ